MHTEHLVRRAQEGHRESREALARAWLGPAYGVALGLTGRATDAEDVVQESFYRVFRELGRLRKPDRFGPWLVRIVKNCAHDRRRRPRAPAPLGDGAERIAARLHEAPDADVVRSWRRLPDEERLVIWLKVVDGMTIRGLADLLGSSKSSVDRTYRRALARLRGEVSRCRRATT